MISNLKIDIIKGTNDRGKEKHKDDVNIRLNNDYKKFWTQDVSNLSINWDSEYLYFWIKEDGYPFEPSLRSKGRQWHLAFYIKISARANENRSNIILIDEPGLFLHARAQKDILKKLEDSAKEVQLIFSTHSPYLLEADKLNRIRLIKRFNDTGTRIENNFHALADKETLTPILTSIGFELNAGIFAVDKSNNIIVEGPSDKFYLDAFKKILNRNNLNFIYGGGSGNMPIVGTILHGWGVNVVYLYDNDKGKKDGEKNLKNNWSISENLILTVLETTGSIEDIFSQYDFKKFVLNNPDVDYSEANSKYVKENKLNKVLLSKKFLEICQGKVKIELDETTINKITELFDKIESKFTDFHITTDEEK
ncbi:MAG: AAA family ATPase [Candidatus Saccharibacteria bacterium]|nr:AAA family ATPase [Candidatus Saccharibacteria bacterium]